ncbi:HTH-type transcriptional regulator ZntR [Marinomonas spartinae]|uniref:MerR family transcriptional regulator n=1 Tax=Marinomonas spartinae TaxID=1792290 RepID=UPI000808A253|nr:MerR family transcriptional regulator [Marinomonas spartinae]SBS38057.1 HTH-type transcriptional regulator ZntR [Marinomonas spartinae]
MRVSELAKKANVTSETVRHYTREGLIVAKRDPNNGYQLYDGVALQRIQFIQQARTLGFSLKQIDDIFQHADSGDSPCPMVRELLLQKVPETKAKIAELQAHLNTMEAALAVWDKMPNGTPDGHSICCLIEDWNHEEDGTTTTDTQEP